MFLCLPPAPPGQRAPRWRHVGSKNKYQTKPWAPRRKQRISKSGRLKGWKWALIACLPRSPVWSRENEPKDRTVDRTHRYSVATIRFRARHWKEQGKPQRPCLLRFLLGPRDCRDSLGAKSKGKEMDKASALEEFLDIITSCPDGGDIRPCRSFCSLGSLARL